MSLFDYFRQPEELVNLSPEKVENYAMDGKIKIIDVRSPREYKHGHIDGAELHPLGSIKNLLPDLEKNDNYLLICATGHRSRAAAATFIRNGFTNISHLEGGMRAWKRSGKNTVSGDTPRQE